MRAERRIDRACRVHTHVATRESPLGQVLKLLRVTKRKLLAGLGQSLFNFERNRLRFGRY